jgi:guanylate kinase
MYYIIISSPSGGGKTTICNMLMKSVQSPVVNSVKFSISATTREKRPHETHGKEYFFISKDSFMDMVKKDEFLEYAEICGNWYGTPKNQVDGVNHILFDIDFQGFIQMNESFQGEDKQKLLTIFLLPPSLEVLRERLDKRGDIASNVIMKRMENAVLDISYAKDYQYMIMNEDVDETFRNVCAIIDFVINGKQSDLHKRLWDFSERVKLIKGDNVVDFLKSVVGIVN